MWRPSWKPAVYSWPSLAWLNKLLHTYIIVAGSKASNFSKSWYNDFYAIYLHKNDVDAFYLFYTRKNDVDAFKQCNLKYISMFCALIKFLQY